MPDVYKGKSYMTEEYFERREIDNPGATITEEEWLKASTSILRRDCDVLLEVLDELEADNSQPNIDP
jgi:hypothetical protein